MKAEHDVTFSAVPVGAKFWAHGREFCKVSSTTARMETTNRRQQFAGGFTVIVTGLEKTS